MKWYYLPFALIVFACGPSKEDHVTTSAELTEQEVKGTEDYQPAEKKHKPLDQVTNQEVNAFIAKWQKSQFDADFETYKALYGNNFKGIKRVGEKSYKYDRRGWLNDRKRMFKKSVNVDVADLKVTNSANVITANFVQTWDSGTYRDVGPKRLTIIKEGGTLKIIDEEMLQSTVADASEAHILEDDNDYQYFLTEGLLYLSSIDLNSIELQGEMEVFQNSQVGKSIVTSTLPPHLKSLIGKEVFTYGGDGQNKVTIEELVAVSSYLPYGEEVMMWEMGEEDIDADTEVWNRGVESGVAILAAKTSGHTGEEIIAVPSEIPEERFFNIFGPSGEVMEEVKEEFTQLDQYATYQAEWESDEYYEPGTAWIEMDGNNDEYAFTAFTDNKKSLIIYGHSVGTCCGEFCAALYGIWELDSKGDMRLLSTVQDEGYLFYISKLQVDTNGDGYPSFFNSMEALEKSRDSWMSKELSRSIQFACGC